MIGDIKKLKQEAEEIIKRAENLDDLDLVSRKYLGRENGELTKILRGLKNLPLGERSKIGALANEVKNEINALIEEKRSELGGQKKSGKIIDFTLPGKKIEYGHLHPLTQVRNEVMEIFHSMGFEILEGPEVETDYYNFEALNIPENHPARDMWDTFYVTNSKGQTTPNQNLRFATGQANNKLLLRAHTSAMQVRIMEKRKPPLKICVIGKCFRHEATDASHEHTLYQIEGFVVDKNVSVANLIYTLKSFLSTLFGPSFAKASEGKQEVKVRLRPSYFPFTEPSFEMDFSCLNCGGKGCSTCKGTGWVEMLGCGMIHPKVFESAGYPKNKYTGFAFGIGLDRLTMMKYKIDDIRWFHSGDLRFIKQF